MYTDSICGASGQSRHGETAENHGHTLSSSPRRPALNVYKIQTDEDQREVTVHGCAQFPLEINHDHLHSFYQRYICCHWHEELEIAVLMEGHIRYRLKDKVFDLAPGEGLVINSRIPHSAVSTTQQEPVLLTTILHPSLLYGTPASIIYQRLICPYLNAGSLSGIRLLPSQAEVMKRIDTLFEEKPFGFELRIKSLLCGLFSDLLSPCQPLLEKTRPAGSGALTRLALLLEAIHESYTEPLSLRALAERICVSRESCCRFFKKMTGKTISEYLQDYRISQSVPILANDCYSIEQTAQLVGFGNAGRFSAAFARHMGCTPRQYRQRLLQSSDPAPSVPSDNIKNCDSTKQQDFARNCTDIDG